MSKNCSTLYCSRCPKKIALIVDAALPLHDLCVTHMVTYERVMSRMGIRHVTRSKVSCHTQTLLTALLEISRVTWQVLSRVWMSHVTCMNESCHMYVWVMSHVWMSHVTQTLLVTLLAIDIVAWHVTLTHAYHRCDMTHSYVWHGSFVCVTWVTAQRLCSWLYLRLDCVGDFTRALTLRRDVWLYFLSSSSSLGKSTHVTRMDESCRTYEWGISRGAMTLWLDKLLC